jgi:hypothetical protein
VEIDTLVLPPQGSFLVKMDAAVAFYRVVSYYTERRPVSYPAVLDKASQVVWLGVLWVLFDFARLKT